MAPHDGPQLEVKTLLDIVSEAWGRPAAASPPDLHSVHKKSGFVWTADGFSSLRVFWLSC